MELDHNFPSRISQHPVPSFTQCDDLWLDVAGCGWMLSAHLTHLTCHLARSRSVGALRSDTSPRVLRDVTSLPCAWSGACGTSSLFCCKVCPILGIHNANPIEFATPWTPYHFRATHGIQRIVLREHHLQVQHTVYSTFPLTRSYKACNCCAPGSMPRSRRRPFLSIEGAAWVVDGLAEFKKEQTSSHFCLHII